MNTSPQTEQPNRLTFAVISRLPQAPVEFSQLQQALEQAQTLYGKAAEIERAALEAVKEAEDTGYLPAVVNDLRVHAALAESLRRQAYRTLDLAKAALLALQS